MNKKILGYLPLLGLGTASAALADPQGEFNGPAGALPAGLSLAEGSGVSAETYVKPAGASGPAEALHAPLSPETQDFTLSGMFPQYADVLQIDAHSSGNATIHDVHPFSFPPVPNYFGVEGWMELAVSVDNDSKGLPGSLIAKRVANPTGRNTPGADLIGFFMRGSTGIASSLPGRSLMEIRAERLGFGGQEDPDAFDFGVGIFSLDPDPQLDAFFDTEDRYYFSLDPACVDAVNQRAALLGTAFAGGVADPASIYWVQMEDGAWGPPLVYRSASELGLSPQLDNLDALEVDPKRENVVFSTQPHPHRSQLRFLDWDSSKYPPIQNLSDLGDGATGFATQGLGVNDETDDIDAVCIEDPRLLLPGFRPFAGGPMIPISIPAPTGGGGGAGNYGQGNINMGVPKESVYTSQGSTPLGLAVARGSSSIGPVLHLQASGFGDDPPSDGVLTFHVKVLKGSGGLSPALGSEMGVPMLRTADQYLVDWDFPVISLQDALLLECRCSFESFSFPGLVQSWDSVIAVE